VSAPAAACPLGLPPPPLHVPKRPPSRSVHNGIRLNRRAPAPHLKIILEYSPGYRTALNQSLFCKNKSTGACKWTHGCYPMRSIDTCRRRAELLPASRSVRYGIADPPILSSSPRNGSGTAMNADLSLVELPDSSACPARSLQNVPVRPLIAQSTPSFFCTFLHISQKISVSQRLRAGCSLDTEGIGRKSQEKEGSWFCTEVAVEEPIGRPRFVLSSCLLLRLTNRWPVPQEPYRQEPFLVDEDRMGGSAIRGLIAD